MVLLDHGYHLGLVFGWSDLLQPLAHHFGTFHWYFPMVGSTRPDRASLALDRGFEVFDGVIIGLTTGIAQWVILRRKLHWAGWWIIFSVIGCITGLTLLPGVMLTGTMAGALTGLALEILLRHPKLKTIRAQTSSPDRLDL